MNARWASVLIVSFLVALICFWCDAEETKQLTLEESIELALQTNRSILKAKERVAAARAGLIVARAGFFPSLSLQGNYVRLDKGQKIAMGGGSEVTIRAENTYSAAATVEQPIFTWGRVLNAYRQARFLQEMEEENYKREKSIITLRVTESFYNVILAKKLLEVAEESYAQVERHLNQVEKRYENGLVPKFDLLRAKVQLANLKPQVIKARNTLTLAEDSFKSLLQIPAEKNISLKGELRYEPVEVELSQAIEEALRSRPEIRALKAQEKVVLAEVQLAEASNKPIVSAFYKYQFQRPYHWKDEWGEEWNAMLLLQFPIFNGFSTTGKIRQSRSRLNEVRYSLEDVQEQIRLEVREAYLSLRQEEETIASQEENVRQAEEAMVIAEKRYTEGLITNLEFMDTQLALTQAKTAYLQSLTNFLVAKARLWTAMGK